MKRCLSSWFSFINLEWWEKKVDGLNMNGFLNELNIIQTHYHRETLNSGLMPS
jgi:hypothetical protein